MKERKYFSHYTPEGKTADDMRSDYSIESSVMENIAMSSEGTMNAALGLEYSPTHRNTLLRDDISFLGIGMETTENGESILVELFQKTPLSSQDIKLGNQEIYKYIEKKFPNSVKSHQLENIAKEWSAIMTEKNEANTDFGNGNSWKNILDKYDISSDTGIFVLSHESPEKIIKFLENNNSDIDSLFYNKSQYGLSLQLSSEGIVYLCIISSE